jgi:hypothetical protein
MTTDRTSGRQAGNSAAASYWLARFAAFFFAFGVCGDGGVFSIRRTTSSNACGSGSRFGFAAMVGV